jgi:choline dehydrogenase-like flavoprotein
MSYLSARDHRGSLILDCDVVVVGSGASGAVVATELAESGQRVIVLEEGAHVPHAEYGKMRVSESLRHIWRDGGMTIAIPLGDSPAINVTMGKVVGGSSVLTGGVCFRLPGRILHEWQRHHGLPEYTEESMEEATQAVERHCHIETVPTAMRSRATTLFDEGARKRGFELKPLRRNTKDCKGCGRCNFGCPEGAKLSVDLSYLPRGVKAGATVYSHCVVNKVLSRGGRAVGVTGRILNGTNGALGSELTVHARRVVLACSAWYTPLILERSGVGAEQGAGQAHDAAPRLSHDGALRRARARLARRHAVGLQRRLRGSGRHAGERVHPAKRDRRHHAGHRARASRARPAAAPHRDVRRHDPRRGRRHRAARLRARAHRDLPHGARGPPQSVRHVRALGETYLAAGAKEVFPPLLGLPGGLSADAFRKLDLDAIPMSRFETSSQHPLGTARMGKDPVSAVVDADGRAFDMEELYVVDGSVLPTSLGVNPQLSIMSIATRLAWRMRERPLRPL